MSLRGVLPRRALAIRSVSSYRTLQGTEAGMMRDLPESVGSHSGGSVPTRAM